MSMSLKNTLSLLAACAVSVNALAAPRPHITPLPLPKRQAGVDPIYDGLGQPFQYDLTTLPPVDQWPIETITTGEPATTTTTSAGVVASTVTADNGELHSGDVVLSFTDTIADALGTAAEEAAAACGFGARAKKVKRQSDDVLSCIADQATRLSDKGGVLDAAGSEEYWNSLVIELNSIVDSTAPAIAAGLQVLTNAARRNKYLLIAASIVVVGKETYDFAQGLRIPAAGVGPEEGNNDQQCDPNKEADENSPLCKDCSGGDDHKCTTGDDTGCPCLPFFDSRVNELQRGWMDEQQQILHDASSITDTPDLPDPECDMDKPSQIPYNVFQAGTYNQFCEAVMANQGNHLTKTVSVEGNELPLLTRRSPLLNGRTPPPNPAAYTDWRVTLDWTGGDGSCSSDCAGAYYNISQSPCGRTAGQQNIMALEGKLDTGCGIYSYIIEVPDSAQPEPEPPAITVAPISCISNPGNIGCWKDVHADRVDETCDEFNKQFPGNGNMLNSQSPNITQVLRAGSGVTYMMNIGWILGCDIVDEQNAERPADDQNVIWQDLLKNNYYDCLGNNGLGGWTDVGCLRYGFYPNNAGTFSSPPKPLNFFDGMNYCGK